MTCTCAECIYSRDSYTGEICNNNTLGWRCLNDKMSKKMVPKGYISRSDKGGWLPSDSSSCLLRLKKLPILMPDLNEEDLML